MTVGDLLGRLLWVDRTLPVVFRLREPADGMAVEVAEVEALSYLPVDAIVAREPVCLVVGVAQEH